MLCGEQHNVCDDEGKIVGKPYNRALLNEEETEILDLLVGTFIIVGEDSENGEFVSLTDEMKEKYLLKFKHPDVFVSGDAGLTVSHLTSDGCILIF